jgi:hypothetical protein
MADIGAIKIRTGTRSTIVSQKFQPKPNVSMSEINDVSLSGLQDGYTLVFNSTTNTFETQPISNVVITQITGGFF